MDTPAPIEPPADTPAPAPIAQKRWGKRILKIIAGLVLVAVIAFGILVITVHIPEYDEVTAMLASQDAAQFEEGRTQIEDYGYTYDPTIYYVLASALWDRGEKEEALFWFYAGQLRLRYAAAFGEDPTGAPALLGALNETIGPTINQYAAQDPSLWIRTIDKVLAWDDDTTYIKPAGVPEHQWQTQRTEIRDGLAELKSLIAAQAKQTDVDQ